MSICLDYESLVLQDPCASEHNNPALVFFESFDSCAANAFGYAGIARSRTDVVQSK